MGQEVDIVELLARVPFFSELDLRRRKKLAKLCIPRTYPVGAPIIEEGTTGLGMFVIVDGLIEVFKTEHGEKISVGNSTGGDLLGEMSLVDDQPRSASAVAVKHTECLLLTRDSFRGLVKKDTVIAWSIVPFLVNRIRDLNDSLMKAKEHPPPVIPKEDPIPTEPVVAEPIEEAVVVEDFSDSEPETEAEASPSRLAALALRLPFAAMFTSVTLMSEVAGSCEASFEAFARGSGLNSDSKPKEVLRQLPNGLMTGSKVGLERSLKIPGRLLDRLRDLFNNSSDPEDD